MPLAKARPIQMKGPASRRIANSSSHFVFDGVGVFFSFYYLGSENKITEGFATDFIFMTALSTRRVEQLFNLGKFS